MTVDSSCAVAAWGNKTWMAYGRYGELGSASLFMNWGLGLCRQRGSEAEPLIKGSRGLRRCSCKLFSIQASEWGANLSVVSSLSVVDLLRDILLRVKVRSSNNGDAAIYGCVLWCFYWFPNWFHKNARIFCGCLFGWASAKFGFSLIAAADSPHMSVI